MVIHRDGKVIIEQFLSYIKLLLIILVNEANTSELDLLNLRIVY